MDLELAHLVPSPVADEQIEPSSRIEQPRHPFSQAHRHTTEIAVSPDQAISAERLWSSGNDGGDDSIAMVQRSAATKVAPAGRATPRRRAS
jgi:hypothetical protein